MDAKKYDTAADASEILGSDWFEKCANHLNDAIIVTEVKPMGFPGPRILWANDIFYQLTGYQPAEVIGMSPRILQGPLTSKTELQRLRTALKNWQVCRIELLNYKKDGSTFWNEFEVTPIADKDGYYTHWISVQRDVSERKLLELKLIENEERYALAIEGANVGIWDLQVSTDKVYFSPIWKTMLGYTDDELVDATSLVFASMVYPDDKRDVFLELDNLLNEISQDYEIEFRLRHKLGHYIYIHSHATAVRDEHNKIVRVVGTHVDVSERKRAEAQLSYQS